MHKNWEIIRLVLILLVWTASLMQDMYKTVRPRNTTGIPTVPPAYNGHSDCRQHNKCQELLCNLPADPNPEKEVEVNRQVSRLSNVLVLFTLFLS